MLKISKRLIVLFFSLFFLCGLTTFGCLADGDEVVLAEWDNVEPTVTLELSDYCNEDTYKTIIADVFVTCSDTSTENNSTHARFTSLSVGLVFNTEVLTLQKCEPSDYVNIDNSLASKGKIRAYTNSVGRVTLNDPWSPCRVFFTTENDADEIAAGNTVTVTVSKDETATYFCSGSESKFISKDVEGIFTFNDDNKALNTKCVFGDFTTGTPATCTTPGTKAYFKCKYCGKCCGFKTLESGDIVVDEETVITDLVIKATGHVVSEQTKVAQKDATCIEPGVKEHYKCDNDGCNVKFLDAEGTQEATGEDLSIPAAHKYSYVVVEGNNSEHKVTCENCDATFEKEEHTFTYDDTKKTFVCKCGFEKELTTTEAETTKTIILNRTTQDLIYAETLDTKFVADSKNPANGEATPKAPERYTYENYESDKYTLKLNPADNSVVMADYKLLVNGEQKDFGTPGEDKVYSIEIDVTAPVTLVTIEAPFNASMTGIFNNNDDAQAVLNRTYRN